MENRVDRALSLTFLKIGAVVDIYLGCKKNERAHPINLQNAFYRPGFHDVVRRVSQKSTFSNSSYYIPTEQKFYVDQYLLKNHSLKLIFFELYGH